MSTQISRISDDSMDALKSYSWPGNIRELQNFMERAVILTRGDVLELPPLPSRVLTRNEPVTLRESERHHLLKALEATNWVVGGPFGAAARLGMPRTTLVARMQKHGISRAAAHPGN
jgi:formate hydrogenlyase transcriptional activator